MNSVRNKLIVTMGQMCRDQRLAWPVFDKFVMGTDGATEANDILLELILIAPSNALDILVEVINNV